MSAYVVENETINCIVNALIDWGFISNLDAVEVGQQLFDENVTSVNYRYKDTDGAPVFRFKEKTYKPLQVFGCVKCWQYQSCEHTDYENGKAWQLTDKLLAVFPPAFKDMDYPWGL